jgi:hypothetical protein
VGCDSPPSITIGKRLPFLSGSYETALLKLEEVEGAVDAIEGEGDPAIGTE